MTDTTLELVASAEVLASLLSADGGVSFPSREDCLRAREAIAAWNRRAPDGAEPVPVAPSKFEREIHEAIVSRLISLTVGSCSCHTMSPDLKYHTHSCRYRIAAEALELVRPLFASPAGMGVTEEQVERVVSVVEQHICVIWARPGARAEFAAEIAAALHPTSETTEVGNGWQPIETALRDGPAFLVWCPERHNIYLVISPSSSEPLQHFGPGNHDLTEVATHWMPLPTPPEARHG